MKTKLTYLAFLMCVLTFASYAIADTEEGFYEKNHIRGFISVGGDYRGMRSEFQKYVNQIAFINGYQHETLPGDSIETVFLGGFKYSEFDDYYIGLHVNVGAQYKQFLTWFSINFMPTQISERPSSTYTAASTTEPTVGMQFPLFDVRWFAYGADWMFGWKLFGESSPINLIPAVGFGFNLINFHFASNFDLPKLDAEGEYAYLRDRYYSTMATTFNAELELRIELGQFGIGAYGGYRVVRYNELEAEGNIIKPLHGYDTDNVGDTWYIGARLTWTFLSDWQKKQNNKL